MQLCKHIILVFTLTGICCFNKKTVETMKDLSRIDTLEVHRKLEVSKEPTLNHPSIGVQATKYGSGSKFYKRVATFKYQPTSVGWATILIPSVAIGVFGYTKISQGNVVLGRDLIGTSFIPPLLTLGFSMFTFSKSTTVKESFNFNVPYTEDKINVIIDKIAYSKSFNPDGSGHLSLDLLNYLALLPANSDIRFNFSLADKSVNPCVATINSDFLTKLKVKQKRKIYAEELLAKGDSYYDKRQFSKAYQTYKKISEQYSDTDAALEVGNRISKTKKQIELAKKQEAFNKMKYKNIDFLSNYGFSSYSIALLTSTLNKLKDEMRIVIITEGLNMPAKDVTEAWSAYNKLSIRQKLYGLLLTVELLVGKDASPFYKKSVLKEWIYRSDLAEKLSYVRAAKCLSAP